MRNVSEINSVCKSCTEAVTHLPQILDTRYNGHKSRTMMLHGSCYGWQMHISRQRNID